MEINCQYDHIKFERQPEYISCQDFLSNQFLSIKSIDMGTGFRLHSISCRLIQDHHCYIIYDCVFVYASSILPSHPREGSIDDG